MNILVIGAGSVGIAVAASLFNGGNAVHMIARGDTKAAIEQRGIARIGLFDNIFVDKGDITAFEEYAQLPDDFYDYILVTAKTLSNDEISERLNEFRGIMRKGCCIVIMQNGWGNEEAYLRFFTQQQLYSARVITGFTRTEPSVSKITVHSAPILLGSLHGCDKAALEPLAAAINSSKLPCETTDELSLALWAKMLYNTTLNPLGAVLNSCYGELYECSYSRALMSDLIKESFAVMDHFGHRSYWSNAAQYEAELFGKLIPATYYHRSSTLQDIERRRITEIETLNGCIIRMADAAGIPVPNHLFIYRLIKSMEYKF